MSSFFTIFIESLINFDWKIDLNVNTITLRGDYLCTICIRFVIYIVLHLVSATHIIVLDMIHSIVCSTPLFNIIIVVCICINVLVFSHRALLPVKEGYQHGSTLILRFYYHH